jgi:hypothetical protein
MKTRHGILWLTKADRIQIELAPLIKADRLAENP